MLEDARERAKVRIALLALAAGAWTLLVWRGGIMPMLTHHHAGSLSTAASLQMFVAMNPPGALAAGWIVMLIAMMSPALIPPVHHLRVRSFTHRRARATILFAAGYAAVWIAVGAVLIGLALTIVIVGSAGSQDPVYDAYLAGAAALLLAFVWQCSPLKQRCLNRCHADPDLAAFGLAADRDALGFGAAQGVWCAGSCWPLMLCPMLLPGLHLVAMAIATLLIVSERLERPRAPRWAFRGAGKAIRIAIAQMRFAIGGRAGAFRSVS